MVEDVKREQQELLAQLSYLQSMYSQQYEAVQNDIASYTIANTALQKNIDLLQSAKALGGSDIMISGEGGAYMHAKLSGSDTVMTYVGAGYLVDMDSVSAVEFIRSNQKKSEQVLNRLMSDKKRLESELLDISFKLNALRAQQGVQ